MRSMPAMGRVLALGLMVLFSLALAGQSAWGAETPTKARPDKQGACSYNKNPGSVSLAKAEVEGARQKRRSRGRNTPPGAGRYMQASRASCEKACSKVHDACIRRCYREQDPIHKPSDWYYRCQIKCSHEYYHCHLGCKE